MHEQDEQLGMILTQLGYLCDRLVVELPDQDPDFSHEVNAIGRARILSHLIDDYLAGEAGGHTIREENDTVIPPAPHAPNWRYMCPHCRQYWEMAERCEDFRQVCSDCLLVLLGGEQA
jgi:hypothetical protein